jgi:hypothetical protein
MPTPYTLKSKVGTHGLGAGVWNIADIITVSARNPVWLWERALKVNRNKIEQFRSQNRLTALSGYLAQCLYGRRVRRTRHGRPARDRRSRGHDCPRYGEFRKTDYASGFVLRRPITLSPSFHWPRRLSTSTRSKRFMTLRFAAMVAAPLRLRCWDIRKLGWLVERGGKLSPHPARASRFLADSRAVCRTPPAIAPAESATACAFSPS